MAEENKKELNQEAEQDTSSQELDELTVMQDVEEQDISAQSTSGEEASTPADETSSRVATKEVKFEPRQEQEEDVDDTPVVKRLEDIQNASETTDPDLIDAAIGGINADLGDLGLEEIQELEAVVERGVDDIEDQPIEGTVEASAEQGLFEEAVSDDTADNSTDTVDVDEPQTEDQLNEFTGDGDTGTGSDGDTGTGSVGDTGTGGGGDTDTEGEPAIITFSGESAGYESIVGYYTIDGEGNFTSIDIAFLNASQGQTDGTNVGDSITINIPEGSTLGTFIVADGYRDNSFLENLDLLEATFSFIDKNGDPVTELAGNDYTLVVTDKDAVTTEISGPVFHSAGELYNIDEIKHAQIDYSDIDPKVVNVSFEDLLNGGDNDFNDVRIEISFNESSAMEALHVIEDSTDEPPINDNASLVTLTFDGESAGYQNTVGYYFVDEEGNISDVSIAFENASENQGSGVDVGDSVDISVPDGLSLGGFYFLMVIEITRNFVRI